MGVSEISRFDRVVASLVLVVLIVLLVVGIVSRSGSAHSAAPVVGPVSADPAPGSTPSTTMTPSATTTTTPTGSTGAPAGTPSVPGPVSAVGDSIMLDIQPYLQYDIAGVRVDGLVSRQFEAGAAVVAAEAAAGTLGNVLVVELGTNGTVTPSDFDAIMQAATGVERVVFVNIDVPRPWEAPDNAVLAAGVARHPGVAVLADWNALASGHPEWFTPDLVHLEPAGAQALAGLVTQEA